MVKWLAALAFCIGSFIGSPASAADSGCPKGTVQTTISPDGMTLSLLFDQFSLSTAAGAAAGIAKKTCEVMVPLHLAAGNSLGIYKVDYRGFAHLGNLQSTELLTRYAFAADKRLRENRKLVKGPYDSDFAFSELVGERTMRRAGCGDAAVLRIVLSLTLLRRGPSDALTTLDSVDGAPKRGLVYHFNLQKCP